MSTGVQKHPFHLVDPSPWPLFTSVGAFMTTFGGVIYFHGFLGGELLLSFGFLMILYAMFVWWRDVIREATFQGHHTWAVQDGLRIGMILFIVSEVMFFMAFFGLFFIQVWPQPWTSELSGHQKESRYSILGKCLF